ncbi:Yip1 family protein [Streptomyces sp. NPDC050617]|uniref:Yip1 family protein n=1 Tax=Streptomyces sp. NPDC050617 TaxID=3154628 RepID=UPI00343248B8
MAGFRIGRGRDDSQSAQQGQQRPGQQQNPPPAQPPYGRRQGPYDGRQGGGGGQGQQWQQSRGHGEPEYFGGPPTAYGQGPGPGPGRPHDPHYGQDRPGQTQQFNVGEGPGAYDPYGGQAPYNQGPYDDGPYNDGGYHDNGGYDGGNTYRAGQAPPPPVGPRLPWKDLLSGIVLRPSATFWQMRDHPMWATAITVTFVYGLLAVFGFDKAREDVLKATLSNSIPWVLTTAVIVVIASLILGAVTHTLARQLGGDGEWQPTVGLSMLIMSITDAPRLLFAMFLGGDSPFVQVLGWATWLGAGALFTSMVSKSHDLPWPKALAASAIQLVALLTIIKLGTF